MKTLSLIMFLGLLMSVQTLEAQTGKFKEIKIKTSAQCDMCKETIEEAMAFERGVKSAELDMETRILTVKYHTRRTDAETIKKAIAKEGYDADEVKADPEAYKKLEACCKKPEDR